MSTYNGDFEKFKNIIDGVFKPDAVNSSDYSNYTYVSNNTRMLDTHSLPNIVNTHVKSENVIVKDGDFPGLTKEQIIDAIKEKYPEEFI